jgi:hypothetical protein
MRHTDPAASLTTILSEDVCWKISLPVEPRSRAAANSASVRLSQRGNLSIAQNLEVDVTQIHGHGDLILPAVKPGTAVITTPAASSGFQRAKATEAGAGASPPARAAK